MPSSDDEDDDLLAPVFSTKLRKEPTPCSLSLALGGNSVGKESTNETIIKQIKKETYDVCFDEVKKRGKPSVESLLTTTILLSTLLHNPKFSTLFPSHYLSYPAQGALGKVRVFRLDTLNTKNTKKTDHPIHKKPFDI